MPTATLAPAGCVNVTASLRPLAFTAVVLAGLPPAEQLDCAVRHEAVSVAGSWSVIAVSRVTDEASGLVMRIVTVVDSPTGTVVGAKPFATDRFVRFVTEIDWMTGCQSVTGPPFGVPW